MCGGDWRTEWQKLWGKIIKVLDKWAAEISDGRNSGAGLPSVEFIFFKNYIKLELIPLMGVPRQVCTWLHVCLRVCVFTSSDICPDCNLCVSSSLLSVVFCLSSCSTLRARWTLHDSQTNRRVEIPQQNDNKLTPACSLTLFTRRLM